MIREAISFLLMALPSIIIITNPILVTSAFLPYASNCTPQMQKRIIRRTSMMSFIVLAVFAITGTLIFKIFSITIGAFQIAGGIILFTVAINMLQGTPVKMKGTPEEIEELMKRQEVGVVPLAIPMVSGPGAITTVIVLAGDANDLVKEIILFLSIAIAIALIYIVMSRAIKFKKFIGASNINVINRLMGLILAAVAAQFVVNGVISVLPEILRAINK